MLTERQELVLRRLVEEHLDAGVPVGSKALSAAFEWGPSTIRHELANLEELGLLAHPHTSAGRVPTEAGYRYFVDRLLPEAPSGPSLSLSLVRRELDEAMRVTTETLSQVTDLLAIVTAPPIETSTIRHIEVLALQPQVLMVVVITSTGGVTKRLFTFPRPVDTGLADWAVSYLNERLIGLGLGARILHQRLHDPGLSAAEAAFLEALAPVFTDLEESAQSTLYVGGTAKLLTTGRMGDVSDLNLLMEMLERRVALLEILRSALSAGHSVAVRIGAENEVPALRSLALVAAGYGLPQRTLGAVSVIGPLRMDYGHAIRTVREAAAQLSSFVSDVYDER
jgi:heat-inducible transcriptional repressor